jgi:oligopeptide/dipeptide ABC transporter ATP-binding protein
VETILEARDLRVLYRTKRGPLRAVDGLSFDVALPPGAKIEGTLRFEGKDLVAASPEELRKLRGKDIALVFQDPMTRLDPLFTIEEHFVETIRAHEHVSKEQAIRRAREALASMGIPDSRLRNYPHEFSGGMRQRIMIAMSLVLRPKLLIADEPTTSLDVIVEAQILEILEDLKKAYRMSLVLITHNLAIVAEVCDRVAVMYAGKFVELGNVRDVFKRPIHPYTRGLLASIIHLDSTELSSIDGLPPDLVNPPPACRFHPRCPYVQEICRTKDPEWIEYRPGQFAACHFGRDFL